LSNHVVTLNAGSSSIKFALFAAIADRPDLVASGQIEQIDTQPVLKYSSRGGQTAEQALNKGACLSHSDAIGVALNWIGEVYPDAKIAAIGHRVVHGGSQYSTPVIVDAKIFADMEKLSPLAPLHQPHNLEGISAAQVAFPGIPQVACFDTAFHRGHAFVHDAFALPLRYFHNGLRRYGFHGLSYEYISRRMRDIAADYAGGRVIVAHLGSGASMCALREGRSIASTMGFSVLDGLPMGTRCGQIDPGLILYLLTQERMSPADLSRLLYEDAGLKGISGISHDLRILEASDATSAKDAIDYFVCRIRMEIGGLTAALDGLDALIFTGGIGENSSRVRAAAVVGMEWLGIELDAEANLRHQQIISSNRSRPRVFVLKTDEEAMIAFHTIDVAKIG
jgi:acetate kinase